MFSKELLESQTNRLIRIAAVIGGIIAIAGGYTWYINNFWKPKVVVKDIDYDKGTASINLNGNEVTVLGDNPFSAGGNWAVRLGSNRVDGKLVYDRLELTKFGNVVEYIVEKKKI
jgi:hypothetical protein